MIPLASLVNHSCFPLKIAIFWGQSHISHIFSQALMTFMPCLRFQPQTTLKDHLGVLLRLGAQQCVREATLGQVLEAISCLVENSWNGIEKMEL